jgi:hypothetical protein
VDRSFSGDRHQIHRRPGQEAYDMKFLDQKEIVKMVPAKRLRQSIAFLQSKHTHLQRYNSLEDFIEALISEAPKNVSAFWA